MSPVVKTTTLRPSLLENRTDVIGSLSISSGHDFVTIKINTGIIDYIIHSLWFPRDSNINFKSSYEVQIPATVVTHLTRPSLKFEKNHCDLKISWNGRKWGLSWALTEIVCQNHLLSRLANLLSGWLLYCIRWFQFIKGISTIDHRTQTNALRKWNHHSIELPVPPWSLNYGYNSGLPVLIHNSLFSILN